jgi:branched-chain amino acid transport system substrate-binding protein
MKKWNIWKGMVVLTLALGVASLTLILGTSSLIPPARGAAEPINIGLLIPYTGTLGWVGACQVGVDIAKDEINAAGGVLGRPIEIKIVDDETKSDAAIAGEEKLINIDKVPAIIGPTSVTFRSVLPLAEKYHVVQLSPTAGSTALDFIKSKFLFRTVSSDLGMGTAMVFEAKKRGHKKAALFYADDESSQSNRGVNIPACKILGIEIVADITYNPRQASYRSELMTVFKNKPDVVFFECDPQTAAVVFKQVTELGLKADWIGTDYVNDQMLEATWPYSKGVGAVQPAAKPSDRYKVFAQEVEKRTKKPGLMPLFTPNAYDALNIICLALESGKKVNGDAVAENMRVVANPPGTKVYNFPEGVKLLRQGKKIDYEGLCGSQNFDETGNVITSLGIIKIEDNKRNYLGYLDESDLGETLQKVKKIFTPVK